MLRQFDAMHAHDTHMTHYIKARRYDVTTHSGGGAAIVMLIAVDRWLNVLSVTWFSIQTGAYLCVCVSVCVCVCVCVSQ